jgi:predicted RNA binding protein YcfA (HicA-like mRNA interferase family)
VSKIEKLISRLKSDSTDFTWDELVKVLTYYGYEEMKKGKTGGSRRKFCNKNGQIISLHKPHPSDILKSYVIKEIITHLNL